MADDDNPLATAPAPSNLTAGAMLAQAREKASLSIDFVALQLKLAPRQVRALESGDFAALPGRTFVRGFVRNYARLLDIDAQSVLAALPAGDDAPGLAHPHLASTHRVMGEIPADRARRRSFAGLAIVLALCAIIAVAVLYEMLRPAWPGFESSGTGKPAVSAPANQPAPAPASPPAATPPAPEGTSLPNPMAPAGTDAAPSSGAATGDTKVATTAIDSPTGTHDVAAAQASSRAPAAAASVAGARAPAAGAMMAASPAASSAGDAPAAKASTLQIIFRGTSWLDVKDANGTSVLTMTGSEGATRTLSAMPPLDLTVGNADHVDVIFRGARVDLTAHAKQNVARLQLR